MYVMYENSKFKWAKCIQYSIEKITLTPPQCHNIFPIASIYILYICQGNLPGEWFINIDQFSVINGNRHVMCKSVLRYMHMTIFNAVGDKGYDYNSFRRQVGNGERKVTTRQYYRYIQLHMLQSIFNKYILMCSSFIMFFKLIFSKFSKHRVNRCP